MVGQLTKKDSVEFFLVHPFSCRWYGETELANGVNAGPELK